MVPFIDVNQDVFMTIKTSLPDSFRNTGTPPAVVSYMSYSGLGIVRSLGRRGIPVVALDPDPRQLGMSSRFCCALQCPDQKKAEQDYLDFLLELGRQFGRRAVYYPTGDNTVLFYARHREVLAPYYRCVMAETDLMKAVVSKDGFDRLCTANDIPAPQTFFPADRADLEAHLGQLIFPAIIKPTHSHDWKHPAMVAIVGGGTKALRTDDAKQLLDRYDRVARVNPALVIQELIPGPDDALYYCCGYVDQQGTPRAAFVGRKLRVEPIHLGSASFVISVHHQEIIDISLRFLDAIGYRGLYGIEYKLDARDGRFKAIEFNARFGLWDILAKRCGIDIPHIAYLDANDQAVETGTRYRAGVKWVAMELDIAAFRQYHREGTLSFFAWLRSLAGEKLWAVADWGDPRPFIDSTKDLLWGKAQRLFRRAIPGHRRFAK
jgi:D-aspartate ligase